MMMIMAVAFLILSLFGLWDHQPIFTIGCIVAASVWQVGSIITNKISRMTLTIKGIENTNISSIEVEWP